MRFAIRDATLADLPAIVAIYNEGVSSGIATADTSPVSVTHRETWFHAHNPKTRPVWVAERNGQIAGWLSFTDFYGRPAYSITAEVSLYVATAHRRQGVARALLAQAVQRAPALDLSNLLAFVFDINAPSIALFEGVGFTRWGLLPTVAVLNRAECGLFILGLRLPPR